MNLIPEQWTREQLLEVEEYYAKAREEAKSRFGAWLPRQKHHQVPN